MQVIFSWGIPLGENFLQIIWKPVIQEVRGLTEAGKKNFSYLQIWSSHKNNYHLLSVNASHYTM